jgi:hypothetical protein
MFDHILPAFGHVRIELKRLKMNFDVELAVDVFKRLLNRAQAYRTPGAGNI